MTTVAEMMLEVGRFVTDQFVTDGVATAGSTTSLTDTVNLLDSGGFWTGGTLFLKTCTQTTLSGTVVSVTSSSENKLNFATLSKTITAGDTYAVVYPSFSRNELLNGVLQVLRSRNAEMYDETTTVVSGQTEYDLPDGVKNVHRVMIDDGEDVTIHQHWHEINSKLIFPTKYAPSEGTIQLIYCTPQGTIAETGTIHSSYDDEAVKWSAIVNVLRMHLNRFGTGADAPYILDKMKEAAANEQMAWSRARRFIPLDMRLA
jgi:hypothetical protein